MNGKLIRVFCAAAAGIALAGSGLASAGALAAARTGPARPAVFRAFSGRLYGVAAVPPRNAWAVGLDGSQSLIVHWNGRTWTRQPAPAAFLYGVAATSATNAWAVGGTNWFHAQTVILHWDGTAWKRVPSPSPGPNSWLGGGVAATSARSAWAVGVTGHGGPANANQTGDKTLIEHWNGTAWTQVPAPSLPPESALNAVTATSARNAWAVGVTGKHINGKTLILHWNGTAWTRVPSPTPAPGAGLLGVAAASGRNAWAVGQTSYQNSCSQKCVTVTEHWNGTAWTLVPSPNRPHGHVNYLYGIAAHGRYAWATGSTDFARTLIVRWNTEAWK